MSAEATTDAGGGVRTRRRYSALSLPLLAAWGIAFLAAAFALPGETLEVALLGAVGAVAVAEARAQAWSLRDAAVGALFLAAPLLGTWPARKWEAAATRVPAPLDGLVNLHSMLVMIALVAGGYALLRRARVSRLALAAAGFLIAGAIAGALVNHSASAFADAWVAVIVPVGAGLLAASAAEDIRRGWSFLALASLGVIVPVVVGIAAYDLSFGLPTSGNDLVFAKLALFRPHLFQDVTFGNVGHFGDIALLLLPAAALGATVPTLSRPLRIASAAAAAGLTVILVLVLSRAALLIGAAEAVGVLLLLARGRKWRAAAAPVCVLVVFALVFTSPAVRASFGLLVTGAHSPSTGALTQPARSGSGTTPDASEQMRASAIRTGLRISRDHLPFGVGSGRYPQFDPVHTAPHSLPVQILAEDGILGAVGFILLVVLAGVEALRLLRRPGDDEARFLLCVACLGGIVGFLVDAVSAGAPLALGQLNVWPLLLWLQVGLLVGSMRARA